MPATNKQASVADNSDDRVLWCEVLARVTHGHMSEFLMTVVREQHERRGYGKIPTLATVTLVVQSCEDEGIFGPAS